MLTSEQRKAKHSPPSLIMNREPVGRHKSRFTLALPGLALSAGSVLYWQPLQTLCQRSPDKMPILLPVYTYLFLLNPLNFYLNMLLLVAHIMVDTGAAQAPPAVFLKKHLPWVAHAVSLATLFLSAPLFMLVAINEESIDLAIDAALACVALVAILCSCFKKMFGSSGNFVPVYFSLFISTGFFTYLFSDHNHYEILVNHTPIHLIMLFLTLSIFLLGTILAFRRIGAPTDKKKAAIETDNTIIIVLSFAISALLVAGYLEVFISVADVAEIIVKAGEP